MANQQSILQKISTGFFSWQLQQLAHQGFRGGNI